MKSDIFKWVKDLSYKTSKRMILQIWSDLVAVVDVSHAVGDVSVILVVSWCRDVEVVHEEVSVLRVEDGVEFAVLFAHWFVACEASPMIESISFVHDDFLPRMSIRKFDSLFDFDKPVSCLFLSTFHYL
jgi:hypothetical protein